MRALGPKKLRQYKERCAAALGRPVYHVVPAKGCHEFCCWLDRTTVVYVDRRFQGPVSMIEGSPAWPFWEDGEPAPEPAMPPEGAAPVVPGWFALSKDGRRIGPFATEWDATVEASRANREGSLGGWHIGVRALEPGETMPDGPRHEFVIRQIWSDVLMNRGMGHHQ